MQHGGKVILQGVARPRASATEVRARRRRCGRNGQGGHLFAVGGQSDRPIRACGQFEFDDVTRSPVGSNLNFGDAAGENGFNAARSANAGYRLECSGLPRQLPPWFLCVYVQKRFLPHGRIRFLGYSNGRMVGCAAPRPPNPRRGDSACGAGLLGVIARFCRGQACRKLQRRGRSVS